LVLGNYSNSLICGSSAPGIAVSVFLTDSFDGRKRGTENAD
jgi:hypothetical protein